MEEINYLALINICTINIALNGKRALIEIKIPLLEDKYLELTRIISLPVHGWIFHSIISNKNPLVLLDLMRLHFIPISQREVDNAKIN